MDPRIACLTLILVACQLCQGKKFNKVNQERQLTLSDGGYRYPSYYPQGSLTCSCAVLGDQNSKLYQTLHQWVYSPDGYDGYTHTCQGRGCYRADLIGVSDEQGNPSPAHYTILGCMDPEHLGSGHILDFSISANISVDSYLQPYLGYGVISHQRATEVFEMLCTHPLCQDQYHEKAPWNKRHYFQKISQCLYSGSASQKSSEFTLPGVMFLILSVFYAFGLM